MLSPYRMQPINTKIRTQKASNTIFNNNSQDEDDLKKPRLTSNDLKGTPKEPVKNKRNKTKGGDPGNIQISEKDLIEQAFS